MEPRCSLLLIASVLAATRAQTCMVPDLPVISGTTNTSDDDTLYLFTFSNCIGLTATEYEYCYEDTNDQGTVFDLLVLEDLGSQYRVILRIDGAGRETNNCDAGNCCERVDMNIETDLPLAVTVTSDRLYGLLIRTNLENKLLLLESTSPGYKVSSPTDYQLDDGDTVSKADLGTDGGPDQLSDISFRFIVQPVDSPGISSIVTSTIAAPDATPEASQQISQTPEASQQISQTPEASQQISQTPEASQQISQTPDASQQISQTPQASQQISQTPQASQQTPQTLQPSLQTLQPSQQAPQPSQQTLQPSNTAGVEAGSGSDDSTTSDGSFSIAIISGSAAAGGVVVGGIVTFVTFALCFYIMKKKRTHPMQIEGNLNVAYGAQLTAISTNRNEAYGDSMEYSTTYDTIDGTANRNETTTTVPTSQNEAYGTNPTVPTSQNEAYGTNPTVPTSQNEAYGTTSVDDGGYENYDYARI